MNAESDTLICLTNIGPGEQRRRLIAGIIGLAFALAMAGILIAFGFDRPWRILLFFPLYGGWIGVFQARDKT